MIMGAWLMGSVCTSVVATQNFYTIDRLLGHPGASNYGMALAASCVLAATTALVMLLVERLRVPSLGAF